MGRSSFSFLRLYNENISAERKRWIDRECQGDCNSDDEQKKEDRQTHFLYSMVKIWKKTKLRNNSSWVIYRILVQIVTRLRSVRRRSISLEVHSDRHEAVQRNNQMASGDDERKTDFVGMNVNNGFVIGFLHLIISDDLVHLTSLPSTFRPSDTGQRTKQRSNVSFLSFCPFSNLEFFCHQRPKRSEFTFKTMGSTSLGNFVSGTFAMGVCLKGVVGVLPINSAKNGSRFTFGFGGFVTIGTSNRMKKSEQDEEKRRSHWAVDQYLE